MLELQQSQQPDHAALRVVIAREHRVLGREQRDIVGQLSLQEGHDVGTAHAQRPEVGERDRGAFLFHGLEVLVFLAFPVVPGREFWQT